MYAKYWTRRGIQRLIRACAFYQANLYAYVNSCNSVYSVLPEYVWASAPLACPGEVGGHFLGAAVLEGEAVGLGGTDRIFQEEEAV